MKKNFLKKSLLLFSTCSIFSFGVYAYGCAGGWWGIEYVSMFAPETFVDKSYKPLFYEPNEKFYEGGYLGDNLSKFNEDIVKDWKSYLGNSESEAAIKYYLLNDSATQYVSKIIGGKSLNGAKFTLNPKNDKTKDFLEFLQIAKKVEEFSTSSYDYWDYENRKISYTDEKTIATIENFYDKIKNRDAFYKNRVWFQIMKAKFYSTNVNNAISFFNNTREQQPKNLLYYRALGYVAGSYYQKQDFLNSNVLFAEIFNDVPQLRNEALYNFKPLAKNEFEKQLKATDNTQIKASLWAMYGYYNDVFEAMQEIYKIDSKSEHLNFLLTRWVNMQETEMNVYQEKTINLPGDYHKEISKTIDQKQFKWINEVASQPEKLHTPALWYLSSGYLNIFQGEFSNASKLFANAAKVNKLDNQLVRDQIRLLNLINNVSQVKKIDEQAQSKLIADLNWLYYEVPSSTNYDDPFRYTYASGWIKKYLSSVYRSDKNLIMAEILNTDSTFFDKESNGKGMEEFFLRKNKTAWEELFIGLYPFNLSDIYECRTINLFYADKLDEAIAMMQKIEPISVREYNYDTNKYENKLIDYKEIQFYGNPFNGKIKDCNDCDHQAKQSVKYTKLSFLQKIKELQTNVTNGIDVYNNALLIGNAYYNASYYGNGRMFYYNAIFGEYGNYVSETNKKKLYNIKQVQKYYNIALKAAADNEQKAKITYLLTKVERNNFYFDNYFSKENYWGYDQVMVKKWSGYKQLKDNYSDTKYYQEVIKECGYFRKYLGLQQ